MSKKVVFDVDDTLWELNKKVCDTLDISVRRLTEYKTSNNKWLTADQYSNMLQLFEKQQTFENIEWFEGVERLIELDADLYMYSTSYNKNVASQKRLEIEKKFPFIPSSRIISNIAASSNNEQLPNDIFILVDDNPYNIQNSDAKYNIILTRPWNTTLKAMAIACVGKHQNLYYCRTFNDIIDLIKHLLSEEK